MHVDLPVRPVLATFVVAALGIASLVTGCGRDSATPPLVEDPGTADSVMADFSLLDVNPNSATTGSNLSPRQFLGEVSAWYFGAAT